MYWEQTAVVGTEQGITEEFQIKKGVGRDVCCPQVYLICTLKNIQRNRRYGRCGCWGT